MDVIVEEGFGVCGSNKIGATARNLMNIMREIFPGHRVSVQCGVAMVIRDFILQGYLKEKAFKCDYHMLQELKKQITRGVCE